ncbi:MAG TPA: hypothetical protein VGO88_10430 [Mycetocola sp.]|jgi:hypothetical protein|uniref:hypothetical protein n=1 Tax=Mycetocola sp. TaxID=1871042 RepID=UPI0026090E39|nr:hypothetical protein [Mycetocola sp.]MCU1560143.1 hypothetical protein [Mycetocola sp.]HEV7849722.1 hypothetical protein [Mycetocola sp.]
MADANGVVMTLPTDRRDRDNNMGEHVQILNLEEIREDLASTVAEIRRRVSGGIVIAVVAGFVAIVIAAVVAITTGEHGRDGDHGPR